MIEPDELDQIFDRRTPLIDVRAPIEFSRGSLPGAVNLPLLNDGERARVGYAYKNLGREEAVRLGHELISGDVRSARVEAWATFIAQYPTAVIYCFRGGLRSGITQQWLSEMGLHRPLIRGGYKTSRRHLLARSAQIIDEQPLALVTGPAGSGKTRLLNGANAGNKGIDLEGLARHRGSAFGRRGVAQPSQADFENRLAVELLHFISGERSPRTLWLEDESRLIGNAIIPPLLFNKMRASPVVWIDEPLERRTRNILEDYVLNSDFAPEAMFENFLASTRAIEKKLGRARALEISALIENSRKDFFDGNGLQASERWIKRLLAEYYDPLYLDSIDRRQVKVIYRGPTEECAAFMMNHRPAEAGGAST